MNPEIIISTWLQDASIAALIGSRYSTPVLPRNTEYPALVFNLVDAFPRPFVGAKTERELAQARIQFNPIAKNIADIKSIADAMRALFDCQNQQTIAGKLVVSMRLADVGAFEKDIDSGLFMQRYDYIMMWYET